MSSSRSERQPTASTQKSVPDPFGDREGWSASGEPVRRVYIAFAVSFGLLTLAGLVGYRTYPHPANDFFAFNSFSRFIRAYPAPLIYDQDLLRNFQGLPEHKLFAFMYHPGMLLLLWPLAHLPYNTGYVLWIGVGLVACSIAVAGSRESWPPALLVVVAPSTLWTMLCGQSSLLVAALIVGGMRLSPRHPLLAGFLIGLATYKPQLGILVPVALVAAKQWRTLAAAAATASCIVVASTLVFGASIWLAWLHHLPSILAVRSEHRMDWASLLVTVTSNLAMAGVGRQATNLVQLLAAAGSTCCVWRCFRVWRPHRQDGNALLEVAALGAATFLATPFAFNYDLPLFTASVLLFVEERRSTNGTFLLREMLAIVSALLLPCFILVNWLNGCSSLVVLFVLCTILHRVQVLQTGHGRRSVRAAASPGVVFRV